MTPDCQPPPNTPDGTLCVLTAEGFTPAKNDRVPFDAVWRNGYWHSAGTAALSVRKATLCGLFSPPRLQVDEKC